MLPVLADAAESSFASADVEEQRQALTEPAARTLDMPEGTPAMYEMHVTPLGMNRICTSCEGPFPKGRKYDRARANQGHSSTLVRPQSLGWVEVQPNQTLFLFHATSFQTWRNIMNLDLIPGGMKQRGGRIEVFFTGQWNGLGGGPKQTLPKYPTNDAQVVIMIDFQEARDQGCIFWITPGDAVVCREVAKP